MLALLSNHPCRFPREEKSAGEIHSDDLLPLAQIQLGKWLDDVADGGVINEDIEMAKVRDDALNCLRNGGFLGYIASDADGIGSRIESFAYHWVFVRGPCSPVCHDGVETRHRELAARLRGLSPCKVRLCHGGSSFNRLGNHERRALCKFPELRRNSLCCRGAHSRHKVSHVVDLNEFDIGIWHRR